MSRVYVIGIGPGSPKSLTRKAENKIRQAGIIVGWRLELDPVRDLLNGKELYLEEDYENYEDAFREALERSKSTKKDIAILRNGDPCVSGHLEGIVEIFKDFEIEVIPGISSVQLVAARARMSLDKSVIVSFHYPESEQKEKEFMVDSLKKGKHLIVLSGSEFLPDRIAEYLISCGIEETTRAMVYQNLSLENESLFEGTLEEIKNKKDFIWLSITIIKSTSTS